RGSQLALSGPGDSVSAAREPLNVLYTRLKRGQGVDRNDVDATLRMVRARDSELSLFDRMGADGAAVRTQRRLVTPRTPVQADYLRALRDSDMVFALGPAGTGKTYLAVAVAAALPAQGTGGRPVL